MIRMWWWFILTIINDSMPLVHVLLIGGSGTESLTLPVPEGRHASRTRRIFTYSILRCWTMTLSFKAWTRKDDINKMLYCLQCFVKLTHSLSMLYTNLKNNIFLLTNSIKKSPTKKSKSKNKACLSSVCTGIIAYKGLWMLNHNLHLTPKKHYY